MSSARYQVQGLPFRRSADALQDSPFLCCMSDEQWAELSAWVGRAPVGAEWAATWYGEECVATVTVKRVS